MDIPDAYIYNFLDIVKDTGEFMTKSLDVNLVQTGLNRTMNAFNKRKEELLESIKIIIDNKKLNINEVNNFLKYSDSAIKDDFEYGQFLIDLGNYLQIKQRKDSLIDDLAMARKHKK